MLSASKVATRIQEGLEDVGYQVARYISNDSISISVNGMISLKGKFNFGQIFAINEISILNSDGMDNDNYSDIMNFIGTLMAHVEEIIENISFEN